MCICTLLDRTPEACQFFVGSGVYFVSIGQSHEEWTISLWN